MAPFLAKLNLFKVSDFWYLFPRRYEDRRNIPPISQIKIGEQVQIVGAVGVFNEQSSKQGKSILRCKVSDGTGSVDLIWFNQAFIKKVVKPGSWVIAKGKCEWNSFNYCYELAVSDYEYASAQDYVAQFQLGAVVPVYPLVAGLTQSKMRQLARDLVTPALLKPLKDPLPVSFREKWKLNDLAQSVYAVHFPASNQQYAAARFRLVFEEFFYFQLSLGKTRLLHKQIGDAPVLTPEGALVNAYIKHRPYTLTDAQWEASQEIFADVKQSRPMNRLLQGDVGCGKTDVAALTLLAALQSGFNAAFMAPTEILADQHFTKLQGIFSELNVSVVLIKGSQTAKARKQALAEFDKGIPTLAIGTHALLEDPVTIPRLGVVVIDEQHKFGVVQRQKLIGKGIYPHCLFMTATPIPRSFMLTFFGDLDKTIINQLPPGRIPPKTTVVTEKALLAVWTHCKNQIALGYQVYVVYPLVAESEVLDLKSATEGFEFLSGTIFKGCTVGLVHGKLKPAEKKQIMDLFKQGEIQVLVSTTVIEVGVDVPTATTMIIQHAERFGLAQLHQLRGRIGRGSTESFCFLVATSSMSKSNPRLKALVDTTDGFKLAEYDLKIRGPGDMLGLRQSGLPNFKLADLIKDEAILLHARKAAQDLLQHNPNLDHPGLATIRAQLQAQFPASLLN